MNTKTAIHLSEAQRARVAAFQLTETSRMRRVISQADILRAAIAIGMDELERLGQIPVRENANFSASHGRDG